jgi:hypothetical protein
MNAVDFFNALYHQRRFKMFLSFNDYSNYLQLIVRGLFEPWDGLVDRHSLNSGMSKLL